MNWSPGRPGVAPGDSAKGWLFRRFGRWISLPLAALVASQACASGDAPVFPDVPSGVRISMELELLPQAFANLTGYFDFDRLQRERGAEIAPHLPRDFLDDYLENQPGALRRLPETLRAELTRGLHLEDTVIREKPRPLLGGDGGPLAGRTATLLLPGRSPPVARPGWDAPGNAGLAGAKAEPSIQSPENFQRQGSLDLPKRLAWQTLFTRWKALSPQVRLSAARWEDLSPPKKAELAMRYAAGEVHLKPGLPPETARLFSRLEYEMDGEALEFRHRPDLRVTDPRDFFDDLMSLARSAGVEFKVLHPELSRQKTSALHYHLSVQGRHLDAVGKALNRLALVQRVELGILNDLTRIGHYLYLPHAGGKGLIRVHGLDHLEFRAHFQPLLDELRFNLKIAGMNEPDALDQIGAEIRERMTDKVLDRISALHGTYLRDLLPYMSSGQRARVKPKVELLEKLSEPFEQWGPELRAEVPGLMESPDISVQERIARYLHFDPRWSDEVWARIPALMRSSSPFIQGTASDAVRMQSSWPDSFMAEVPALLRDPNPSVQEAMVLALLRQRHLTSEIAREMRTLEESPHLEVRDAVKKVLERVRQASGELNCLLRSAGLDGRP